MYNISFVVPVRDDVRIFDCLKSFLDMELSEKAELLIMCDNPPLDFKNKLEMAISGNSNVQAVFSTDKNRRQRRDHGANIAKSEYLGFVDSDCTFDKSYLLRLLPELGKFPVIRGRVIYKAQNSWFSRLNCIFRVVSDEEIYKEESFAPNLIMHKKVLEQAGGWDNHGQNVHHSDDFVLSDSIHRAGYKVSHVQTAIIFHEDDCRWTKSVRTWFGYGVGWGFRYHKNRYLQPDKEKLLNYIPKFPYSLKYNVGYFIFALVIWLVMCLGCLSGLYEFRSHFATLIETQS